MDKIITYDDIRQLYENNLRDKDEIAAVSSGHFRPRIPDGKNGANTITLMADMLYQDMHMDRFVIKYPYGALVEQGMRRFFYRGENQIFPYSESSLSRSLRKMSQEEQKIYRFISQLRIAEFRHFLKQLLPVQRWENHPYQLTVLYDALAQHYGLETNWLDITSDFEVALFFSVCKWDNGNDRWLPLTKSDIEENENTRWGVIYQRDSAINFLATDNMNNGITGDFVCPIGFQPFMRCSAQHGYGLQMTDGVRPLNENNSFRRMRFLHSEKLSETVYQLMDQGKKIYPNEGLNRFEKEIMELKYTTTFSNTDLQEVLLQNSELGDESQARNILENSRWGVTFTDRNSFEVSRQRIKHFNMQHRKFEVEKYCGGVLHCRPVYLPPAEKI